MIAKISSVLCLFVLLTGCVSQSPFASEYAYLAEEHQVLAVLPFTVKFNEAYKSRPTRSRMRPDEAYWQEQQRLAGLDQQKEFFKYLAQQVEKGHFVKVIQDFTQTNEKLAAAGIRISDINRVNPARLAEILNVDAVLVGSTEVNVSLPGFGIPSRDGTFTNVTIYDRALKGPVWTEEVSNRPTSGMDTPARLGNENLRQLAKAMPY
ncbi:hypothetical protein [Jiulongibacter sp. NS-SX5]|uniref:hypothetical protein n=1 Tax=Jiulongibacter sp. NS-SX5 TaxID=3463854 RepID=UPI004058B262